MDHRRIDPKTTAEELWKPLERKLKFIRKHYHGGTDAKTAKAWAVQLIELVQEHFDDLGIDRSLTRPLEDIRDAFVEGERGLSVPLFASKPIKNRPPLAYWELDIRIMASLAVDLLMKAGKSRKEAAHEVAKQLMQLGIKIPSQNNVPPWETVLGWREKLTKATKNPANHGADWPWYGSIYIRHRKEMLREVKQGKASFKAAAERVLNDLSGSLPPFR